MFETESQYRELREELDRYLVRLEEKHLEEVLRWRNRPEVREASFNSHVISKEEHAQWFKKLKSDLSKVALILQDDAGTPCGAVTFNEISTAKRSASWSFYLGDTAKGGTGSHLGRCALLFAFDRLKLQRLTGEVLGTNLKSLDFHYRFGFKLEGTDKGRHLVNGAPTDVHRLAITAEDWNQAFSNHGQNI